MSTHARVTLRIFEDIYFCLCKAFFVLPFFQQLLQSQTISPHHIVVQRKMLSLALIVDHGAM